MAAITLDQLNVFQAVVDAGSFTAASKRLRRAQSAVSYAVANLEAQLDVQLFDRTGKRPVLTAAGRALLADARSVTGRATALTQRARWLSTTDEASIAIGVGAMFPMPVFLDHVAGFRDRFPHAHLALFSQPMGGVARLVVDGTADLAVGHLIDDTPAALRAYPLDPIPTALYAAASHPLAQGPLQRDDVVDHVQIVLSDGTGGKARGVMSPRVWHAADLHTKRAMLVRGFGFGTLPVHLARTAEADGTLKRLVLPGFPVVLSLGISAVVHRERPVGSLGRWFLSRLGVDEP